MSRNPFLRLQLLLAAATVLAGAVTTDTLAAQDSTRSLTVSSPAFKSGQPIPEEFTAYIKADLAKWAKVVKFSGAKAE